MADRRQRWGELRSVEVLGTVPGMEGGLTTTVRLTFERGIGTNLYTWGPAGRVVDIGARPYQSTALVAVGAHLHRHCRAIYGAHPHGL